MRGKARDDTFALLQESDIFRSGRWFDVEDAMQAMGISRSNCQQILRDRNDHLDTKAKDDSTSLLYRRRDTYRLIRRRWDKNLFADL